jgi:pyruvate dehydrogenase E1 component beta subunit
MTWNFSLVAADQIINNAAKIRQMSGAQFSLPVVFRGPGGAAHQLASQHSQALESLYAHVPGLKVVIPSTPADAKGLLKSAIRDNNPVIFIEGETLYGMQGDIPDGEHTIPLGVGDRKRAGKDCTIVAWSKMLWNSLDAAERLAKEGIECDVIDPRTLRPLDDALIVDSVRRTNRCVVVEEGWPVSGFGAEVAYRVQREAFDDLDAPVERVTGVDVPMPYAKNLEHDVLPTAERIMAAVKKVSYTG